MLFLAAAALGTIAGGGGWLRTWTVGPVLFEAGAGGGFDSVAVKDPSIVRYEGRWHLFYTARDRANYTLGYAGAARLEDLAHAPRNQLRQLHAARTSYAAAPEVFYFRPHKKWYLIYQTTDSNYLPVYSTTKRIEDPTSWTPAKPLVEKTEKAKWIDFWVICDERTAYLFFTRDHERVMAMTTKIEDFPNGFAEMRTAFGPVHEAAHVYSVRGSRPGYVMLFEQVMPDEQNGGESRYFGMARAARLAGPWTVSEERFASGAQLAYSAGQAHWTDEVSHGELLRSGWDERLEAPAERWEFLVQGLTRKQHHGEYPLLPWRLGLITAKAE
jgi:hypothetical protein